MQQLTHRGEREVQNLAQRYGVSTEAVRTLLAAVAAGGGTMAQFNIRELGGGGQWMRGGMTMVGDMFNPRLQSTVSGLCDELSALLGSGEMFTPLPAGTLAGTGAPTNSWWPAELGHPGASGGQNDARYAYFPHARRLAINQDGEVTVHDTLDHRIGGVQQQQGGPYGSLAFTSQHGTFTVGSLPIASLVPSAPEASAGTGAAQRTGAWAVGPHAASSAASTTSGTQGGSHSRDEILATLERLGQLHQKGVLSDAEFQSKKAELLARL